MRIEWDDYFMSIAKLTALRSGCNSRPTGAVIVKDRRIISTGYNGTLSGKEQCTDKGERYCRRRSMGQDDSGENKYQECPSIHAEQNAINQAALLGGISLKDCILYCTLSPCSHCIKNIASVGIKEIVYETMYRSDDSERDHLWIEAMKKTFIARQVQLTNTLSVAQIISNFNVVTSYRRL